jgi:hypothetical protein
MNRYSQTLCLLLLGLIASPLSAGVKIYSAPSLYDEKSDRESANNYGIYIGAESFELGYEKGVIKYRNGALASLQNFTTVWKMNGTQNSWRLGGHLTLGDDQESDSKITLFVDGQYYPGNLYGTALFYTHYEEIEGDIWQFSPKIGRYFWPKSIPGTLYFQAQGHAILLNTQDEEKRYYSLDLKSHWNIDPWGIELGGWFGQQRSAVTDGGYTVYNLNDIYQAGLRLNTTLNLGEKTQLKVGGRVLEQINAVEQTFYNTTFTLSINHEFN